MSVTMYRIRDHLSCDDTAVQQKHYYCNQGGGSLPHFEGARNQRGHGVGSTVSGAVNSAMPLLKPILAKVVSALKRKAMTAGMGVVSDVMTGKNIKTAMLDRARAGLGFSAMTGKRPRPNRKPTKERTPTLTAIRGSARGRGGRGRRPGRGRVGRVSRSRYVDTALE